MKTEYRIQINGTWYVKEEQPQTEELQDLIYTQQCFLELDNCTFEATRMYSDYSNEIFFNSGANIKYTNKITKEFDNWDGNKWMKRLYDGDREALDDVSDTLTKFEVTQLRMFIKELIDNKWLNY